MHKKLYHSTVLNKLKCPRCNSLFTNRSNLRSHCKKQHQSNLPNRIKLDTVAVANVTKVVRIEAPAEQTSEIRILRSRLVNVSQRSQNPQSTRYKHDLNKLKAIFQTLNIACFYYSSKSSRKKIIVKRQPTTPPTLTATTTVRKLRAHTFGLTETPQNPPVTRSTSLGRSNSSRKKNKKSHKGPQ